MTAESREVIVQRYYDGFVLKRVDVSGRSERAIEKLIGGFRFHLNIDEWRVYDTVLDGAAEGAGGPPSWRDDTPFRQGRA